MSHHGRLCVEHLRHGEDALERLGGLWPAEEQRIRHGVHTAITRRLEPAFTEGQQIVVSYARSRRKAVRRDGELTGEVIPAMKTPSLVIEMAKPRRHRKGHWLVPFRVTLNNRHHGLYLMPGSHAVRVDDKGRPLPMSQAEEHGMNSDPRDPINAGGVLSGAEYKTVIEMPSRVKRADHNRTERAEERARESARRLHALVRDNLLMMARNGVDPTEYLAQLQRDAKAIEEREAA